MTLGLRHSLLAEHSRRFGLGLLLGLATLLVGCSKGASATKETAAAPTVFRVVRSKQLTALAVVEKRKALEAALGPRGVRVEWLEFAAGPQQIEALNAGELDLALTAESPPAFAQAAGSPIVYLARRAPSGKAVSCLVAADSAIQAVRDLKGKKVAFQKASIGHYLLVKALTREGLSLADLEQVYLPPSDAQAAFTQKKVDAWLIWEPFPRVRFKAARACCSPGTACATAATFTPRTGSSTSRALRC